MNKKVREALEKEDLKALYAKLLAYTTAKLYPYNWNHGHEGALKGKQPIDYVQEAFKRVIAGKRKWNTEKNTDAFNYFKSIIDSLISNDVNSVENKVSSSTELSQDSKLNKEAIKNKIISGIDILMAKEFEQALRQRIKSKSTGPDDQTEEVLDNMFDGVFTPKELSEVLDIEIKKINYYKRRIVRFGNEVRQTLPS